MSRRQLGRGEVTKNDGPPKLHWEEGWVSKGLSVLGGKQRVVTTTTGIVKKVSVKLLLNFAPFQELVMIVMSNIRQEIVQSGAVHLAHVGTIYVTEEGVLQFAPHPRLSEEVTKERTKNNGKHGEVRGRRNIDGESDEVSSGGLPYLRDEDRSPRQDSSLPKVWQQAVRRFFQRESIEKERIRTENTIQRKAGGEDGEGERQRVTVAGAERKVGKGT